MRTRLRRSTARLSASARETDPMLANNLGDLITDREHRIERRHRLLEDHADAVAAQHLHLLHRERQKISSFKQDFSADDARREDREQGAGSRRQ